MVLIRSTSTTLKNHSRAKCRFPLVVRIRTWIEFIQKNKKCSLHRPKGMIATLPYIHHVTALTWNTSFVPDPYIDKKTAKSSIAPKQCLERLQHSAKSSIAPQQWLRRWRTSFVAASAIDKKTARSLHRPEGMIATRTYIQLCLDRKHIMDATTECDRWSEHNRSFFDSASRLAVRRDTQQTEWNMNGCSQDKHPDDRMQPPNATKKCNEEMSHRRLLVDHGDSTSNVEKLLRVQQFFNILTSWCAFHQSGGTNARRKCNIEDYS